MTRRLLPLACALLLAAPADMAAAVEEPSAPKATFPLSEIRPGMQATVRTVFEGDRAEEFTAEIIGVMDNFLGPRQDLILARLKGERVEFTGVAGGMSGSPVYIDGRLAGALSYRMGTFLREPIAGITPIEDMLKVAADPQGAGPVLPAAGAAPGGLEPIEAPIVVSGVPGAALRMFEKQFAAAGLGPLVPGAAASAGAGAPPAPAGFPPLQAGDPVAAQLVRGDLSFAATGTVTLVEDDRVYAFGHPAFLSGVTELPMARAQIYLTLSSLQASSKLPRILDTIGTFTQSRLPAMTGVIGPQPRLIPVTVRARDAQGGRSRSFSYEVVDHREFTPLLVGFLTAASMINTSFFSDEMTLSASGRIGLEGHPDVRIGDLYTGFTPAQPAAAQMARDVQELFAAVSQNRFERARVTSVDLEISTAEKGSFSVVEGVYPTRTELEPGEEVEFRVLLRPFQGERHLKILRWRVPEGTPRGPLSAWIGGAGLLGAAERGVLSRQVSQADDLDQLIELINHLRANDRLYLKVTRRHTGAIVHNEILPALPPSVLSTLGANRGTGEVTPLTETTVHEDEIPLEQIVVGGTLVHLKVR